MLVYWIWYAQLKKLSCAQKQMLLQHFRDPEEIYHSDSQMFHQLEDLTEPMVAALEEKDLTEARQIIQDCANKGIRILTLADAAYPARLKNTYDPPMVLYFKGQLPDWNETAILGVVGTRKSTPYGMRAAYRYGSQIAACGGLVVSGGAEGIDTMALEGALAAGGKTLCVFGGGVDVIYPAKNRQLFERVAEHGCILSEYPPREKALSWHFPHRNRIISGISNGVLVVEAPQRSGALITARHAMEQGRDVYVVPGPVDSAACAGSNALLQDYGTAALTGWDAVKEYAAQYPGKLIKQELSAFAELQPAAVAQKPVIPKTSPKTAEISDKKSIDKNAKSTYSVVNNEPPGLNEQERAVLAHIGAEPVIVDTVIDAADLPAGTVKAILTKLTVKGLVRSHPGGRVSRK